MSNTECAACKLSTCLIVVIPFKMNTETIAAKATLKISSPEFTHEGYIPEKYTCEGENISPPITIRELPKGTTSLAMIMEDPDAPGGIFDHWVVWNIRPTEVIKENSLPGITAKNSRGEYRYTGPCPPSGTHRYFFKVYALDTLLDLDDDADKKIVEQALHDHVIAYGELMGLYQKHN
jgi:Raf kinase inhibitor-like YbhB/YbcL family protein